MPISLVLDIIIAVLLMLTIAYAVRLNQRLSQLRSDKNELQKLAKTFADATQRAETGIQNLKVSSEALQNQMKQAEVLKDDLAYLVDRGSRTADEMVETVRSPKGAGTGKGPETRGVEPRGVEPRGVETRGVETRGVETAGPKSGRAPMGGMGAARRPAARPNLRDDDDDEARLIEDAIRAATPEAGVTRDDQAAQSTMTRRIAGRPLKGGATGAPARGQPSLASRGLAVAGPDNDFEDSEAARELLKALSAVK